MNKHTATDFLRLACAGRVHDAFERHVTKGFRHHNAWFPSDGKSLARGMEENARQNPGKTCDVKQAVEEGDRVVLYSLVHHKPGDRGVAVVHIFRFEDGRIAELWDLAQEIPENMANELGMF